MMERLSLKKEEKEMEKVPDYEECDLGVEVLQHLLSSCTKPSPKQAAHITRSLKSLFFGLSHPSLGF